MIDEIPIECNGRRQWHGDRHGWGKRSLGPLPPLQSGLEWGCSFTSKKTSSPPTTSNCDRKPLLLAVFGMYLIFLLFLLFSSGRCGRCSHGHLPPSRTLFFSAFRFDIRNMLLFTSYPFPARSGKCRLGFYMYSSSLVLEWYIQTSCCRRKEAYVYSVVHNVSSVP